MIQIHIYVEHSTDVPLKVRRIWTFHFNIWIQHQYLFISKNAKWFVFSTIFVFVLYDLFLCKLCSINHYDQGVRIESVFWSLIDIKHMANLYVYMLIDTCTCQINITVSSEFFPIYISMSHLKCVPNITMKKTPFWLSNKKSSVSNCSVLGYKWNDDTWFWTCMFNGLRVF